MMMDYIGLQQTPLLVLLNIIIMLYFFVTLKSALDCFGVIPKDRFFFAKFLIFLFCLFSFWGTDWFHYAQIFARIKYYGGTHMEDVYSSIVQFSPDYLFFRLVVWGVALLFAFNSFKRICANNVLAVLIFSSIWLLWFSYARVSLAMALMFWGVSIAYKPLLNKKIISFIIALCAIFVSFYFHKTAAFGIGIILIATLANKLNHRIAFILPIVLIPIEYLLVQNFLVDYMLADVGLEDGFFEMSMISGQNYLGRDEHVGGIGANIARFLELTPYYLSAVCCLKLSGIKNFFVVTPNYIRIFVYIAFYIILLSSVFAFDFGYSTAILYCRFMRFAFLPCVIVITYCYEVAETHKIAKFVVYLGMLSTMYQLLYAFYCALSKQ